MNRIEDQKRVWDHLGRTDPFWAILSDPEKRGNKWSVEEFFDTGTREIAGLMAYLGSLRIDGPRKKALDFGCGAGRLTRALAAYYDEVSGVDVAPSMIELARKLNVHPNRCHYFLNEREDLSLFPDNAFDLVYSNITLQHIDPPCAKEYIREFVRVLSPGGAVVFQLPSARIAVAEPKSLAARLRGRLRLAAPPALRVLYRRYRRRLRELTDRVSFDCYEVGREDVLALLEAAGAKVLDVTADGSGGPAVVGWRYCVIKHV